MGKISDFLSGTKILEQVESPINGKITVVKNIAFGTYIQVGGLTQSGGIIKNIWNKTLGKVVKELEVVKVPKVLILGLGGGSIVGVVQKYWPTARITAVDFDPEMVKLGMKYLGLSDKSIKIHISDAYKFLKSQRLATKDLFDLVLVDLYVGDQFPKKFEAKEFLTCTSKILARGGVAVFNRLYYDRKRSDSVKFGNLLEKVFTKVDFFYPEANIMFVCNK